MANFFLIAATVLCTYGLGLLALAMESHWKQVRSDHLSIVRIRIIRCLGSASLFASLCFCVAADHPSMAVLVWIMLLAVSALNIALLLAWFPRWLTPLLMWIR